jgi:exonuclease III
MGDDTRWQDLFLCTAAPNPVRPHGDLGNRRSSACFDRRFNITIQIAYEGQTRAETERAIDAFSRVRAWALDDCFDLTRETRPRLELCTCAQPTASSHLQTFRLKNRSNSRSTQLDYAFISTQPVPKLKRLEAVQTETAWSLSDHCPILLELEMR